MRKEELRRAFDIIQPSEDLICSTIDKMNMQRLGLTKERKMPFLSFATRVAAAFCALLLVVSLGFFNFDSVTTPVEEYSAFERRADGSLQSEDVSDVAPAAYVHFDEEDTLSGVARIEGGDWAVLEGVTESVYFSPLTDEEKADGILFRCTAQIRTVAVLEKNVSLGASVPEVDEYAIANVNFFDEDSANEFFNSTGKVLLFRLSAEGDEWEIRDVIYE